MKKSMGGFPRRPKYSHSWEIKKKFSSARSLFSGGVLEEAPSVHHLENPGGDSLLFGGEK